MLKLILMHTERDSRGRISEKWYRTADHRFDILGGDLNTNNAVGRAAGAGPCWVWQVATPGQMTMPDWSGDLSVACFSKDRCVANLELEQYSGQQGATVIVTCPMAGCRQKNRVIVGTKARCGRCTYPLVAI